MGELTERDTLPATGYVAKYLFVLDTEQNGFVDFDANNLGAAVCSSAERVGWPLLTMTSAGCRDCPT